MTVRSLVLILVAAGLLGVIAEYFFRTMGVVNLGGLTGGLVGIIVAMILNRKKESTKPDTSSKSKKKR
ncbi:MAG: hypothetical protein ACKO0X_06100 [Bacteroidota bacterium]